MISIFLYREHTCGYRDMIQDIFPYPDDIICPPSSTVMCEYIAENDRIPSFQAESYEGLYDSRLLGSGLDYLNCSLQVVHAHNSNGHTWTDNTTMIGSVVAVGHGNGVDTTNGDDNPNCGSYGPGLEFYGKWSTESACTPNAAAMMARLMKDHPGWNFFDARAALRQTCWNYTRGGWVPDGGFGLLDWESALTLSLENIELFAPFAARLENDTDAQVLNINWGNFDQSVFDSTVIALYDTEPGRDSTPADGEILYEGSAENFACPYNHDIAGWIGFFTKDAAGNFSKLETGDKKEFNITYDYRFVKSASYFFASPARTKGFASPGRIKKFGN